MKLQPIVDGDLLPVAPEAAIRAGVGSDIPLLISTTAEEFDFLVRNEGATLDDATLIRGLGALGLADKDAGGVSGPIITVCP